MAGPIRIALLADAGQAIKEVTHFRETTEENVQRVVTTMSDPKMEGAFGRAQEGFDLLDTRAMGFRDTITGVQDSMAGVQAFMGQGEHASASFGDKLLLLGTGVGDLASGFANFIVPLIAMATTMGTAGFRTLATTTALIGQKIAMVAISTATKAYTAAQWLLNAAMSANPIGIIILLVAGLVAGIVYAYQKSETFRKIVTGAFEGVKKAASAVWTWIKGNWPLLLAIITGPIGIAIGWVVRNFDKIKVVVRNLPTIIKAAFATAGSWLINAGRNVVLGMWNGIIGMGSWIWGAVQSFVRDYITGPIKAALGIASPSKVAKELGGYFGQGLGLGLDGENTNVQKSARRLANSTIASPSASSGSAAGAAGTSIVLSLTPTGDKLEDVLMERFAKRIRVNGGNPGALGFA